MQYLIRNLLSMRQSLLFLKSYRFLKKWQRGKNTGKRGNFGFVFDVQANLFKSRDKTKVLRLQPLMKKSLILYKIFHVGE